MSEWKETEIGLIPSDWHIDKLENYVQPQRGITYGIVKVGDFVPGGVAVIRGGDIRDGSIVFDDQKRVTEEVSNQFRRTILQGGEILLNLIAEPGHAAIVPDELIGSNVSRDVAVIPLDDSVDHKFVCYFLRSEASINWLTNRLQGTVTKKINLGVLRELPILLISLDEQRRIAHFLDCLDRKIENLRRQNETLERIAQTLFKHWFVDFEFPNEDGKPYKSSGGKMVRSELGEIPAGWYVGKLKEILSAQKGLSYKGEGLADSETGIPMHNLKSIYEGGGYQHEGIKFYKGEYRSRHLCHAGDIIVCNTEQGEKHKLIAYPARIPKYFSSISIYTHHISKLTPHKPSEFTREFIYYLIYSPIVRHQILTFTNGTTVNMLPVEGLEEPLFAMPPTRLIVAFSEAITPMWGKAECNYEQIQTLTKTRDVLLPQLMSGKFRIAE